MVEYIEARGGRVLLNKPLEEIVLNADGSVKGEGRGFRVQVRRWRVQASGFRLQGSGVRIE
jgi:hypothetical protein